MISLKNLVERDENFEQKFKEWFKKNKNSESLKKEFQERKKSQKISFENFAREYYYTTFY